MFLNTHVFKHRSFQRYLAGKEVQDKVQLTVTALTQNFLEMRPREPHCQSTLRQRPSHKPPKWHAFKPIYQLHNCTCDVVCAVKHEWTAPKFQCPKWKSGLSILLCFRIYHTLVNFFMRLPSQQWKETISRMCYTHDHNNIFISRL
jgi:hypothetical protein